MIQRTFRESETVDFVIVGTGAAGGVLAQELATAGFDVVAMEQGPWQHESDFSHDELVVERELAMLNRAFEPDQTFRTSAAEPARVTGARGLLYRRAVGGSSVHFAANYWRFRPVDFKERSLWGPISGTAFADWPITYEELEPFYDLSDRITGVAGITGDPSQPPRSPRGTPPLPIGEFGKTMATGFEALPRSRPRDKGRRPAGVYCSFRDKAASCPGALLDRRRIAGGYDRVLCPGRPG
jgi:choline dehydrogenase-like flavoprotein